MQGLDIHADLSLVPGQTIRYGSMLFMHPLDIIALEHPNAMKRLDVAMKWLVIRAERKFDAAQRRLTIASFLDPR